MSIPKKINRYALIPTTLLDMVKMASNHLIPPQIKHQIRMDQNLEALRSPESYAKYTPGERGKLYREGVSSYLNASAAADHEPPQDMPQRDLLPMDDDLATYLKKRGEREEVHRQLLALPKPVLPEIRAPGETFDTVAGTEPLIPPLPAMQEEERLKIQNVLKGLGQYQTRGRKIVSNILQNPDAISWDDNTGEVKIQGRRIPGSHIEELIHHVVRPAKVLRRAIKPEGLNPFLEGLAYINTPGTALGSKYGPIVKMIKDMRFHRKRKERTYLSPLSGVKRKRTVISSPYHRLGLPSHKRKRTLALTPSPYHPGQLPISRAATTTTGVKRALWHPLT